MGEKKLNKDEQLFVIQQLAMFERPTDVRQKLKEEFGKEVSLNAIMNYQMGYPTFQKDKWEKTFTKIREDFLNNVNAIPIANKSFRVKELDRLFQNGKRGQRENTVEQRATLEQAAKEVGNVFTNKQEHTGANGGAIQTEFKINVVRSDKKHGTDD